MITRTVSSIRIPQLLEPYITEIDQGEEAISFDPFVETYFAAGVIALCELRRQDESRFDAAMSTAMCLFASGVDASPDFTSIAQACVKKFGCILPDRAIVEGRNKPRKGKGRKVGK